MKIIGVILPKKKLLKNHRFSRYQKNRFPHYSNKARTTPVIANMTAKNIKKRIIAIIILAKTFKPAVAALKFSKKTMSRFMTKVISLIDQFSWKRNIADNSQPSKEVIIK